MGKITKIKAIHSDLENSKGSTEEKIDSWTTKPPRSKKELIQILDECYKISPILSYTFEFQAVTGLRYSDASQIEYNELLDKNGEFKSEIHVIQIKKFNILKNKPKYIDNLKLAKRKATIKIAVNDNIKRIVEEVQTFTKDHQYLFSNPKTLQRADMGKGFAPTGIRSANRLLNRVREKLNLSYHLNTHSFRKYFAQSLLENGASIAQIRDLLGQDDISSTNLYLKTFSDENSLVAAKVCTI